MPRLVHPFSGVEIKNRTIDSAACMRTVPANGVTDNESVFMVRQTNEREERRASGKEGARAVCLSDHLLTSLRPLPRGGVGHNTNLLFHRLTEPGRRRKWTKCRSVSIWYLPTTSMGGINSDGGRERSCVAPPTLLGSPCLINKRRAKHR